MSLIDRFVEIELKSDDDFLKVAETLKRIGMQVPDTNIIVQCCYILHKKGKYFILHQKELKRLDGEKVFITLEEYGIRNTICRLLEEWGLVTVVNKDKIKEPQTSLRKIKIIKYEDKDNWILKPNYNIGKK